MLGGNAKPSSAAGKEFALPDYLTDDAFALRMRSSESATVGASAMKAYKTERRVMRIKCLSLGAVAAVLAVLSLCIGMDNAGTNAMRVYAPWDALSSLVTWLQAMVGQLLQLDTGITQADLAKAAPLYTQVVPRAGMTLATLVCGALLACAGMLYQIVFRNPIASPSLLGITHGVQLGLLMLFLAYGSLSAFQVSERFLYGYVGGILTLLVVFALSKLITRRKTSISVFDMLIIGTIISTLLGAICKYLMQMLSTVDAWTLFFEFQEGLDIYRDPVTYLVLLASVLVAFVPIALMRFRLNLLSFSDGEAAVMGANPRLLRALSLIAGSLMILTAQVFVGPASSFALVMPLLSRLIFGSEFRKQLWGNVLLGMIVLLVCRDLSALIPFVGIGIPIGTIAGIITVPLFVWATLFTREAWQ